MKRHRIQWAAVGRSLIVATLLAHIQPAIASEAIERIDPPSWWTGFESSDLQLLVHGRSAASLAPTLEYPGVSIVSTTRLESPNYLAVTLRIAPTAQPGTLPIKFKRGTRLIETYAYRLEARRPGSRDRKGFDASDAIYLVMPDRFANGNATNDQIAKAGDHVDRSDVMARHGGDLQGVLDHLDYVQQLGFTQLWLTPFLENAQPEYSYHGYSITDHYKVDPRFGTNDQVRALSRAARARGIGVIQDVVVNHVGSGHWWLKDLPSSDWISGGGATTMTNNMHSSIQDPYAATVDRRLYIDGWFDTSLPDLNTSNPQLAAYLIQHAIWWIEYADLSSLRMDTYSYSDKTFLAAFTKRLTDEYPHINIVGEESPSDPALVSYWQAGKVNADHYVSYLPSLMDFPIQQALLNGLKDVDPHGAGLRSLYERLSDDFLYPNPSNLVIFADNHDIDRVYSALGKDDDLWRMAMTYIATMRGIPQVFYGSEILMTNAHPGVDGERRPDFPGGWQGDAVNAFTGQGLDAHQLAAQKFVRTLYNWRKASLAVQRGSLKHYAPDKGVYVYFRTYGDETVMVAFNIGTAPQTLALQRFRESLPRPVTGTDVQTGARVELSDSFTLPARSTTLIDIR